MDEKFIVDRVKIDGEDVTQKMRSQVGLEFYSKYGFKAALTQFLQTNGYNAEAWDVDTAADFGEEGDDIYINTNTDLEVEAWGGYKDAYNDNDGIVSDDIIELEESLNSRSKLEKAVREVLNESTTLKYKGHSFVLQVKANSDPTKDGLGVRLIPPFGELNPTEKSDITQDILQRLNNGLSKYGLIANIDTQVKDKSQIAYFMYTDGFKRLIRKALQDSNKQQSQEIEPESNEQPEELHSGEQQNL